MVRHPILSRIVPVHVFGILRLPPLQRLLLYHELNVPYFNYTIFIISIQ